MADRLPTPVNGGSVDANTLATIQMPAPGPSGLAGRLTQALRSPEARAAADAAVGNVEKLSYDAFVRKYLCEPAAQAISKQAEEFVRQNIMTCGQAAAWVNAQRDALLVNVHDERNTPFGRAVSEYLKPKGPKVAELSKKFEGKSASAASEEKVFEAIIRSGTVACGSVNKLAFAFRWAGPVLTMVSVGVAAYLTAEARPDQRGRVALRDAGGLGLAWAGSNAGSSMGERTFDWTHSFVDWVTK